jgi:hypothetical protein
VVSDSTAAAVVKKPEQGGDALDPRHGIVWLERLDLYHEVHDGVGNK